MVFPGVKNFVGVPVGGGVGGMIPGIQTVGVGVGVCGLYGVGVLVGGCVGVYQGGVAVTGGGRVGVGLGVRLDGVRLGGVGVTGGGGSHVLQQGNGHHQQ